jgi:hypothetical protein
MADRSTPESGPQVSYPLTLYTGRHVGSFHGMFFANLAADRSEVIILAFMPGRSWSVDAVPH